MGLIRVNEFGAGDRKRAQLAFWEKIAPVIALAVDRSFVEARMRHPTHAEVKDRALKCKKIVETLKNDLKWSFPRIQSRLPAILRRELLGQKGIDVEEGARELTDAKGNKTVVYGVDSAAGVTGPLASRKTEAALEVNFKGEDDMAGPDEEIVAQETAGEDENDGPPQDPPEES